MKKIYQIFKVKLLNNVAKIQPQALIVTNEKFKFLEVNTFQRIMGKGKYGKFLLLSKSKGFSSHFHLFFFERIRRKNIGETIKAKGGIKQLRNNKRKTLNSSVIKENKIKRRKIIFIIIFFFFYYLDMRKRR